MTEGKLGTYIDENLIFVDQTFATREELFEEISKKAEGLGYTSPDFLEKIKAREAEFPTGLQLENYGVAIPHTDPECVKQEFVAVVVNKDDIIFNSMVDASQEIPVKLAFMLGLNQPHAQLEMLESLMSLLQNEKIVQEILASKTSQDLQKIINNNNL